MSKWDKRFLEMVELVASWSKDPSTKVGAVIVDHRQRVVSVGFNGLPRGIEDTEELLNDRAVKYEMIMHAEVNAILFSNRPLEGCTLYATHPPCPRCAAVICQSGISTVVTTEPSEDYLSRWKESCDISLSLYKGAGVRYLDKRLEENVFGIIEKEEGYFVVEDDSERQITNFTISILICHTEQQQTDLARRRTGVEALLKSTSIRCSEEAEIYVDGEVEIFIDESSWSSSYNFLEELQGIGGLMFLGTDEDVQRIKGYVFAAENLAEAVEAVDE